MRLNLKPHEAAGRASVENGELLAVGWIYPEYLDEMHRGYVFGVSVGNEKVSSDQIKVEVRRAS